MTTHMTAPHVIAAEGTLMGNLTQHDGSIKTRLRSVSNGFKASRYIVISGQDAHLEDHARTDKYRQALRSSRCLVTLDIRGSSDVCGN